MRLAFTIRTIVERTNVASAEKSAASSYHLCFMPVKNRISTPAEADAAFAAAQVVVECHRRLTTFLKSGLTLAQIDTFVGEQIADQKAKSCFLGYSPKRSKLPPFPSHACLSVNECVVHGWHGYLQRPMHEGDVLKIDIGVTHKGWIGDAGWTYVFGKPSKQVAKLMEAGKESLRRGVKQLVPGKTYLAWAREVQRCVEREHGFHLVRTMGGHGLIDNNKPWLHGPPYISNVEPANAREWPESMQPCEPGTLIAVEPMLAIGTGELAEKPAKLLPYERWPEYIADGSVSVHYEHDVLITEKGNRVLTEGMDELADIVMK